MLLFSVAFLTTWQTQPLTEALTSGRVNGNFIWSWWTRPLAVTVGPTTYFGGVTNKGSWRIFKENGGVTEGRIIAHATQADDHNAPSIVAEAGHDTLIFFTEHNRSTAVNYSRAPANSLDFSTPQQIIFPGRVTYSQVLHQGNRLVLLTRISSCKWAFVVSNDYGSSWSDPTTLMDVCDMGRNVYILTAPVESKPGFYHLAAYGHPTASAWRDLVYGQFNITTGELTSLSGFKANLYQGVNLPYNKDSLQSVGPIQAEGQRIRLLEIGDKHGQTIIFYSKWSLTDPKLRYYSAVMAEDGVWSRNKLGINAGISFGGPTGANYVGGITLDHNQKDLAYISSENRGIWTVRSYRVNPNMTLTFLKTVATSRDPLVRPITPFNGSGVIYQQLVTYQSFKQFRAYGYIK